MQRLTGLGVSPGVVVGRALLLRQSAHDIRYRVAEQAAEREIVRLGRARDRSRHQLQEIKDRIVRAAGPEHAYLFDAQLLMLDDPMLVARAAELIRQERANAEWALRRAFDELSSIFDAAQDAYLRERKGDIADVVGRLERNLSGGAGGVADLLTAVGEPSILVADELPPSVAAQIDWSRLVGFAADAGSWTYHTAILARSLQVPAVVGLQDATLRISPGALVVLDGSTGEVVVDPPKAILDEILSRREQRAAYERSLKEYRGLDAVTADGLRIRIDANIELPDEAATAREQGAEGIGLYRSEFLLAGGSVDSLTEEIQYATYRSIVEQMAPGEVTIRTFDLDEERLRAWQGAPDRQYRRFGLRTVGLSVGLRELSKTQVRALLRAGAHGRLRILFPFVSGLEALREARLLVGEAHAELRARGVAAAEVPVGVMIEIPSAALTADLLAREADFLSIGTNDLIQYTLAVDRQNDQVSYLYESLHLATIRLIRQVRRSAHRRGIRLSLCGEMASEPTLLALLVGLGVTEFSMAPAAIPPAKQAVRELHATDAVRLAARVLRAATVAEIEQELVSFTHRSPETQGLGAGE